jgi:hypothetical protein
MLDFNTEPYNDDYDPAKQFYRILYRPSFAVQARELTQMQSILQNQIKTHGDNIFKNGAMVIPGQASIQADGQPGGGADYVKLIPVYSNVAVETFLSSLNGQTIIGQTTGLTATVTYCQSAENADPTTLYLNYTGPTPTGSTTAKTFGINEVLKTSDGTYTFQIGSTSDCVGKGSLASIQQGIYYINGYFVLCTQQTIVLDKYTTTPTYRIGLVYTESIVTPESDETLLDNAQNSYNYAAPGAHRYMIDLTLTKLAIDSTSDTNFVEVIRVTNGKINTIVQDTAYNTIYNQIETEIQRRTYDTNGDYTVSGFDIDVREHRNNNRGTWTTNTAYLIGDVVTYNGNIYTALNTTTSITTPPTHTSGSAYDGSSTTGVNWQYTTNPIYNRGINLDGNENQLAIGIEAGKAYVKGHEIEKTAVTYIPVNKARDFVQTTNSVIPATVGNYVLVTNVNNLPPVDTYVNVILYNYITGGTVGTSPSGATAVGTARVRVMEYHSGLPFSSSTIYKLSLFDVQMNSGYKFNTDVKSFVYAVGSAAASFSADISPITNQLIGSVTASGTTVNGTGTSFLTDLAVNDLVQISASGSSYYRRVVSITNQNAIVVDSSVTVTGATIIKCTTQIAEPENISLIFPLPYYAIRSVKGAGSSGVNNTTYVCYQKFTQNASGTTLNLSTSGTFASAADSTHYACYDNTTGVVFTPITILPVGSNATITVPSAQSGHSITVIATVQRNGSGFEKTKTLYTVSETFTTAAAAQAAVVYLDKADVFQIVSVTMATGAAFGTTPASTAYTTDISDRYSFDNGQRNTHYDWGSLTLLPSFAAPSNPIKVTYQYFEHTSGDYFDVNSYYNPLVANSGIDYKLIPANLRDAIDFRPRVANRSFAVASGGSNFMAYKNFTQTGSSYSAMPKRGESITADYSYYLARRDKVAVDLNGNIFDINGVSSVTPGYPADPALGMVLYTLDLQPYTFGTTSTNVSVSKIDNKRYTMRDIGKLESRINTLEYYTSLSLLEQETQSMKITDSKGLDRMKNGFVVDNFAGNNLGDSTNPDYFCSVDMESNQLRPFYTMYNVNLLEKFSTNTLRSGANYQLTGDIITLPYTTTPLITQSYASRLENINPFAIFTFLGSVQLNPPTDDWFETARLPDIIQQVEGNYNMVALMAEKAGALGTVWNAWQTEWTGQPVSTGTTTYIGDKRGVGVASWRDGTVSNTDASQLDATFGGGPQSPLGGWAHRQVTVETSAVAIGQSRSGVNTSIALKTDYQQIDDVVVSTALIPYIRSRNILVQAHKLKPNTKFYPYFDGLNISSFCIPATKVIISGVTGTFDTSSNVGAQASDPKRRIANDVQVCLNAGDVISNGTGGSAVVVNSYIDGNGNKCLSVVNIIGTLSGPTIVGGISIPGDSITGSYSGATATIVSVTPQSTLTTTASGDLEFLFNIPNTDSVRFRTGSRELKLVDSSTYAGNYTSRGIATYEATGTLTTKQATINAVRNATLVQEQVSDNQVIHQSGPDRVLSDTGWYDPLAQSFLIQQKGGAFLTSIDIFFATKDANIPVTLSIREMINGAPGKRILPFSTVTKFPANVNLSANTVTTADGNTYPTFDTPTTFTFDSPVYVQDTTEYCFVLQSDSNSYNVWISYMGDIIPGSGRTISEQPYAGVMFKSQNASTWTPDQSADIKFTINRAVFNTSVVADVEFVNDVLPYDNLDTDPFETTSGSNLVRVWHYDHGMPVGSTVDISAVNANDPGTGTITTSISSSTVTGVGTTFTTQAIVGTNLYSAQDVYIGTVTAVGSDTSLTLSANATIALPAGSTFQYVGPVNGIPANQVFKQSIISNVDLNSYTITTTANATLTGYTGGTLIRASRNIEFDTVNPSVQIQSFSDTTSSFAVKTTSGKSVDGSQTPYVVDSSFTPCLIKQNNDFGSPRMIASEWNEGANIGGSKSLTFSAALKTSNDAVSPVIDTTRTSLIAVKNILNYPTESNTNVAAIDTVTSFTGSTGAFTFNAGGTLTSTIAGVRTAMSSIGIGKYVTIANATTSTNNGTFLVTGFTDDGTTGTLTLNTTFTGESAVTSGTVTTVSARVLFADEIAPIGGTTASKYVTTPIKFANASTYMKVMITANIPAESDVGVFYKTVTGDSAQLKYAKYTKMTPDSPIVKVDNGNNTFTDITYTLTGIQSYDTATIKIVMNSSNSAAVPIIKDFRVIACP